MRKKLIHELKSNPVISKLMIVTTKTRMTIALLRICALLMPDIRGRCNEQHGGHDHLLHDGGRNEAEP